MKNQDQTERDRQARDIFLRAVEIHSPEVQAAYLEGACQQDASLRSRVEALLENHWKDSFLESAAMSGLPTGIGQTAIHEVPGSIIGRYKLLQKIGEGGMGVVYMAEQLEPVRRRVALKIMKLGMDTKQIVARFEAERQALALMDHPNIAKVLDGGTTGQGTGGRDQGSVETVPNSDPLTPDSRLLTPAQGRPYFVMELVQGVPITEFCDKAKLSARERLKLFIQVCQAIQSAHQKGIIHRDIKPSNVLVTLHDGVPVPKVIDFGIAKATNQKLTEKTLFTHFATMIGTPAYMSPEQAEMSGLDVDTRTDIYALGVLLYALLTGTTPFPEKRLRSLGYGEMQRVIREEEPERPSTRLTHQLEVTRLKPSDEPSVPEMESEGDSSRRLLQAKELISRLKGDLDWIVMKCLEKDRQRRYETASGLAVDIQRHLSQEPVSAVAPSTWYVLGKYARRHQVGLAIAAGIVVLLIAGTVLSTWVAVRAKRAEQAASAARMAEVAARDKAEMDRDRARQTESQATE